MRAMPPTMVAAAQEAYAMAANTLQATPGRLIPAGVHKMPLRCLTRYRNIMSGATCDGERSRAISAAPRRLSFMLRSRVAMTTA